MRPRPRLSKLFWLIVAASACSSSDTILALTVTSGSDIVDVAALHVTVIPASGSTFTIDFAPPLVDGSIKSSFVQRITLPSGTAGPATVTVEARNAAQTVTASGRTTTTVVKDGAVVASVMLMPGSLPPPDGGTEAGDGGGTPSDGGDGGDTASSGVTDGPPGDGG